MKKIFKLFIATIFFVGSFSSCKKDENRVVFDGGTVPALTASAAGPLLLKKDDKDNVGLILNWTNPNYKFNTGVSSQNVTYILQVDTTGKNFTSSNLQEKSIANDLSIALTIKDLNTFLSKMELKAGIQYNVELRVKSSLIGGTLPLYSNVLKLKMTPYLDFSVEPPGTAAANYNDGTLWVTGDAFASGWSNPLLTPYDVSQKFTRIDALHYELIVPFLASGNYKMIQKQNDWSLQYHALAPASALSGEFEKKDSDPGFASPGAGTYKIAVNFQTGKYTLTKQ